MTRDDIIRTAREAGGIEEMQWLHLNIERFAYLVAAAEREACARECDDIADTAKSTGEVEFASYCAIAIRARGEK